jgi:CheY-like chemotaxis protein
MESKKRILYIEDNFQNRRLVKRLLTKKGYELIEAEDGLQGIAIAAREKPDLILMDINLPGIDGMEATSRLKSSPDLAHIPIVAVTAQAMRGDREKIIASGCDDYLQKPIDNDELINTVARFIGLGADVQKPPAQPEPISSETLPIKSAAETVAEAESPAIKPTKTQEDVNSTAA